MIRISKAGRKRRIGVKREKNGRAQRVYVDPKQQVSEQPHRVVVPVEFRKFPEAESEFGRLMLLKRITPAQCEAGRAYAALASQYLAAKGYPPVTPQAMNLGGIRGGIGAETPAHVVKAISVRYNKAFESIGGQRAQRAVAYYAVRDMKIEKDGELELLCCGLNDLVKHFGIDPKLQIGNSHQ